MSLTFFVPPGIGDFSAMYQKLCMINREILICPSMDNPQRMSPYLDILPRVKNGGYRAHGANAALVNTLPPGTDVNSLPNGEYFFAINEWLENGGKVADWILGPVDYHYEMKFSSEMLEAAEDLAKEVARIDGKAPLIGVYTTAYGNSRHWGFWGPDEWWRFLSLVKETVPEAIFALIGADYDLGISEILYARMQAENWKALYLVGQYHIGATVKVIEMLDYFFVFPSGLGFLADVVRTPHLMWFPSHLQPMMGTFTDPEQFDSGQTLHSLFKSPEDAVLDFKSRGLKFLEERTCHRQ